MYWLKLPMLFQLGHPVEILEDYFTHYSIEYFIVSKLILIQRPFNYLYLKSQPLTKSIESVLNPGFGTGKSPPIFPPSYTSEHQNIPPGRFNFFSLIIIQKFEFPSSYPRNSAMSSPKLLHSFIVIKINCVSFYI